MEPPGPDAPRWKTQESGAFWGRGSRGRGREGEEGKTRRKRSTGEAPPCWAAPRGKGWSPTPSASSQHPREEADVQPQRGLRSAARKVPTCLREEASRIETLRSILCTSPFMTRALESLEKETDWLGGVECLPTPCLGARVWGVWRPSSGCDWKARRGLPDRFRLAFAGARFWIIKRPQSSRGVEAVELIYYRLPRSMGQEREGGVGDELKPSWGSRGPRPKGVRRAGGG